MSNVKNNDEGVRPVPVRLPKELKARIKALAQRQERSIAWFVRKWSREGVEREEQLEREAQRHMRGRTQ